MTDSARRACSRRWFLKLSGASLLATSGCRSTLDVADLEIEVDDSLLNGHLLAAPGDIEPVRRTEAVDVLIVGGGVAGLAAAATLRDRDPVVCELAPRLGGSSGYRQQDGLTFSQGAHYELEYPPYYGKEGLALLESLGVIRHDAVRDRWTFVDRRYMIPPEREARCWANGEIRGDVLPPTRETAEFEDLLSVYEGRLPQPTRLIAPELRKLDELSFWDFLRQSGLRCTPTFKAALDYHMKDDYGGDASQVSALAGVHYYRCRPYYSEAVGLFSPPEGNGYFVRKLAGRVDPERLLTGHLAMRAVADGDAVIVDVLDWRRRAAKRFRANRVIYAGQKHALKYVHPADAGLFAANQYAPWVVINIVLRGQPFADPYWQNEVLGRDDRLMGFVNSAAQSGDGESDRTVLTVYYCLPASERGPLLDIRPGLRQWLAETLAAVNETIGRNVARLALKAYVKIHGHAMPIPVPGYLFRDANERRALANLVYAGVDNGRLPLFFEALDSGIAAARLARADG